MSYYWMNALHDSAGIVPYYVLTYGKVLSQISTQILMRLCDDAVKDMMEWYQEDHNTA